MAAADRIILDHLITDYSPCLSARTPHVLAWLRAYGVLLRTRHPARIARAHLSNPAAWRFPTPQSHDSDCRFPPDKRPADNALRPFAVRDSQPVRHKAAQPPDRYLPVCPQFPSGPAGAWVDRQSPAETPPRPPRLRDAPEENGRRRTVRCGTCGLPPGAGKLPWPPLHRPQRSGVPPRPPAG